MITMVAKGRGLDQVGHIHRHLINLCVVKLLYILKHTFIFTGDKIDGHTLTSKTTTATNPV